jgi:AbrB family looped-hinge helix DNA binding protein
MGKKKWVRNNLVEKVTIDERGRVTIPKSIREKHNFIIGAEFEIVDENDKLILKLIVPKQKTVKSSEKWGKFTFLKAGESTFGE